jgi:hypothetical protein
MNSFNNTGRKRGKHYYADCSSFIFCVVMQVNVKKYYVERRKFNEEINFL